MGMLNPSRGNFLRDNYYYFFFLLFLYCSIDESKHVHSLKCGYQYNFIHPNLRNVSANDEN